MSSAVIRWDTTIGFVYMFTVFVNGTFDLFDGHFDRQNVQSILPIKVSITTDSIGFFHNSKPMVAQFAQLAKLAQLVQMAQLS